MNIGIRETENLP